MDETYKNKLRRPANPIDYGAFEESDNNSSISSEGSSTRRQRPISLDKMTNQVLILSI